MAGIEIDIDMREVMSREFWEEEDVGCGQSYETYLSQYRESLLKCQLTRMRIGLINRHGFKKEEILRALLSAAQDMCRPR